MYRLSGPPAFHNYMAVTVAFALTFAASLPPGHFRVLMLAAMLAWVGSLGLWLAAILGRESAQHRRHLWFHAFFVGTVLLTVLMVRADVPLRLAFRLNQREFDRLVTGLSTFGKTLRPPWRVGPYLLESPSWSDELRWFAVRGDELKSKRFFVYVPDSHVEWALSNPRPFKGRWKRISKNWFVWSDTR